MPVSLAKKAACALLSLGMLGTAAAPALAQSPRDRDAYMERWYRTHQPDDNYREWRRGNWSDRDYRRWYNRHHRNNDRDNLGAAALFGLAAGAIAGGVIANQAYPDTTGSVGRVPSAGGYAAGSQGYLNYCSSKYRSFDPSSGTYVGYDGQRHYCQ